MSRQFSYFHREVDVNIRLQMYKLHLCTSERPLIPKLISITRNVLESEHTITFDDTLNGLYIYRYIRIINITEIGYLDHWQSTDHLRNKILYPNQIRIDNFSVINIIKWNPLKWRNDMRKKKIWVL